MGESVPKISCHPLPSFFCHSKEIVPPDAAKVEIGFVVPVIAGSGSSPEQIGLGPVYEIIFPLDIEFTLNVITSSLKQPVPVSTPEYTLTLISVPSFIVSVAVEVSNVLVGEA